MGKSFRAGRQHVPSETCWSFTLRLNRAPTDDEVDALYEAGLDDTGIAGETLTVDREADSLLRAIASAAADVRAVPGLRAVAVDTEGDDPGGHRSTRRHSDPGEDGTVC
jgi:hypothetical protein